MSTQPVTFKKYSNLNDAKQLEKVLLENDIATVTKDNSSLLGGSFSGEMPEYEVQIFHEDFEKATGLLQEMAGTMLGDVPEGYYLLEFTDDELYDVLINYDEWGEFDYLLARKMLSERGKDIDDSLLKGLRERRLAELSKPEPNQRPWIIGGYILALLGGFFGIITGYVLWTSKKTLPNGTVVSTYSKNDREQGKIIMILGLIMLPLFVILRILFSE